MVDRDPEKQAEYLKMQISPEEVPVLPPFNSADFEDTLLSKLPSYYCQNEAFDTDAYKAFSEYLGTLSSETDGQILPHVKRVIDKLAFPLLKGWAQKVPTIGEVRVMTEDRLKSLGLPEGEVKLVRTIFPASTKGE